MKKFKVAHIVPVAQLTDTAINGYHMCLAHLLSQSDEYTRHFKRMVDEGKFVLMDNGAAEGDQLSPDDLIAAYHKINPTEIVLPDTLYDGGSTIQKSRAFLKRLADEGLNYRVMAVPQGENLEEWTACARIFLKDRRINTIGVSKFLNIATKDPFVRFKACEKLQELIKEYDRQDIEVHLLGCDEGPVIVSMCHEAFPFVRGCDSAFAYLAAQLGVRLTYLDGKRPKGTINFIDGNKYFSFKACQKDFNDLAKAFDNEELWED